MHRFIFKCELQNQASIQFSMLKKNHWAQWLIKCCESLVAMAAGGFEPPAMRIKPEDGLVDGTPGKFDNSKMGMRITVSSKQEGFILLVMCMILSPVIGDLFEENGV